MRRRKSDRDKVAETVTQRDRYSDSEIPVRQSQGEVYRLTEIVSQKQ